jgi:hypothetical protein
LVLLRPAGQTLFFEVKASTTATAPSLSLAQRNITSFESSAARGIRNRTVGERAGEHAAEATNLLDRINDPVSPLRIQGRSLV